MFLPQGDTIILFDWSISDQLGLFFTMLVNPDNPIQDLTDVLTHDVYIFQS